jgi:hypothetical protein
MRSRPSSIDEVVEKYDIAFVYADVVPAWHLLSDRCLRLFGQQPDEKSALNAHPLPQNCPTRPEPRPPLR